MIIRSAIIHDIPVIMDMERACATAAHWNEEEYRRATECAKDGAKRQVLVAELDNVLSVDRQVKAPTLPAQGPREQGRGSVVGFLVARRVTEEWELENIVVSPEFRERGIGIKLLAAFVASARESNCRTIFLEVRESNLAARKLYEKTGFRETGRRKDYYSDPPEDAVLYSLTLFDG